MIRQSSNLQTQARILPTYTSPYVLKRNGREGDNKLNKAMQKPNRLKLNLGFREAWKVLQFAYGSKQFSIVTFDL